MSSLFRDPIDPSEDLAARHLRAWSERAVSPVDAVAVARSAMTGRARPRPLTRISPTVGAAAALAAIVVLGLGVVFLAGGPTPRVTEPGAESSAAMTSHFLPDEIPEGVRSGVIDTPIGSARWVHLTGDAESLPGPLWPVPGPSSLLWFDGGGIIGDWCSSIRYEPPQLWTSADAVAERVQLALPIDARWAMLTQLGDTWWLTTTEPTTLWRSSDVRAWQQVDLAALVSPGSDRFRWELSGLGVPAASGDVTIVPVRYRALDPGRLLGRPDLEPWTGLEPLGGDRYRIIEDVERDRREGADACHEHRDAGEILIEETDGGLRIAEADGSPVLELDEIDADLIEELTRSWSIGAHGLAVISDSTAAAAALPDLSVGGQLTVFATDAGFDAFLPAAEGPIRTWHSDDGRTWLEGDMQAVPSDAYVSVQQDWGRPSSLRADGFDHDRQKAHGWETFDGTTWTRLPEAPGAADAPRRIAGGWLAHSSDETAWWASIDGETWQRATELEGVTTRWELEGRGSMHPGLHIGDTLFRWMDEDGLDRRDLWVIEFEPGSRAASRPRERLW